MAKKSEFRPDKSRNTLLSHLILTQKQRRSVLKWALYALVLVFLSVVSAHFVHGLYSIIILH
jgi:hypothetical protein